MLRWEHNLRLRKTCLSAPEFKMDFRMVIHTSSTQVHIAMGTGIQTRKMQSLTCRAGSAVWLIRAGTHKAVGLGKAEVSAASIVHPTEVGA